MYLLTLSVSFTNINVYICNANAMAGRKAPLWIVRRIKFVENTLGIAWINCFCFIDEQFIIYNVYII